MIRAKVIRILSDTRVILNAGRDQGVSAGMRFRVISEGSDDIVDPETGEKLGTLMNVKGVVLAREVFDRFTIAGTEESLEQEPLSRTLAALASSRRRLPQKLDVDESQIQPLFGGDSAVRVGDEAVQVVAEETRD